MLPFCELGQHISDLRDTLRTQLTRQAPIEQEDGVDHPGALGLMTITPGEGSIIAADIASKSAAVNIEFVDRFTGCLLFTGEVSAVETALRATVQSLKDILGFFPASITHS